MKKLYLLLLIFILVLPACSPAEIPAETSAEATEAPLLEPYVLAEAGSTAFTVIRPDQFDQRSLQATIELRRVIKEKYGVEIPIATDWSKDNKENATVSSGEDVFEILIGDTNRAESRAIADEFPDMTCGYVIKATNGKIVIWGTDIGALNSAIEYFTAQMLTDGALTVPRDFLCVWDLSGEGMPLDLLANNYAVICSKNAPDKVWNSADMLASKLSDLAGVKMPVNTDSKVKDQSGKEILIGDTDRPESAQVGADLQYMDYAIKFFENKIVIVGGSPLATQNAVNDFISLLTEGKITSLDAGYEYKRDYHSLIADSLAFNQESFVPKWASEFTPAAWMLDFDEKTYAITTPDGRMMADAHRGDVQHYPENSLEARLSALMMGADVVEIDVRLTKDNIMVLMHDASLKRTTDWSKKAGKNGLPSSDKIEDWTYEQLRELRLLYGGKATDCIIPTMYEAALLFAGKAQIHFDCKVSDQIDRNSDVYLLAEETGSKESFVYYYGISVMQQWQLLNKDDKDFANFVKKMTKYLAMSGHGLRKRNFDLIEQLGDHAEGWKKAWDQGYKMTFTNKVYDFSKYIAANCEPFKLP